MRYIPASILNKIKKPHQTKAENADPRINLVIQRTKKYIEQGAMLQPIDLWTKENLGAIDIAYRRESRLHAPEFVYAVYVEGGTAHLARIEYIKSIEEAHEWTYLYPVGPAVDVAIEFDGRWERTSPEADICFDSPAIWSLVTFGEPWIIRVTAGGALIAQHGQEEPYTLVDAGVTRVGAIRGWKNTYLWNHDQGIVCAYIRGGLVCYRNYAQQPPDMPAIWEQERVVDVLPSPAQNVSVFRTNDYRAGIIAESNGQIYWAVTGRNWATMAIEPHTITAAADIAVELIQLTRTETWHEHLVSADTDLDVALLWGVAYNSFRWAENDGHTTIYACAEHFLSDITPAEFQVYDEGNALFSVLDVQYGDDPCVLVLTVDNLAFSIPGDLTLKFLGSGTTKGEAGQDVDPFEITFTPTGIEYEVVDPPAVEVMWNE